MLTDQHMWCREDNCVVFMNAPRSIVMSTFMCILLLLHTHKTSQASKDIFTNSLNSDCKVNLVVHVCDVSNLDICSLGANFLKRESNATAMEWIAILKLRLYGDVRKTW